MRTLNTSLYQNRLWLGTQLDFQGVTYNVFSIFTLRGELNENALCDVLQSLVNDYSNFRSCFIEEDDEIKQATLKEINCNVERKDISQAKNKKQLADTFIKQITDYPFDLSKPPLFKFGLLKLAENEYSLVLNFHYIIADNFTTAFVFDYLSKHYGEKFDTQITEQHSSFEDYIAYERSHYTEEDKKQDVKYWKTLLKGSELFIDFPFKTKSKSVSSRGRMIDFSLDDETSKKLKEVAEQEAGSLPAVLSTLYAILVARYFNKEEVILNYQFNIRPEKFKNLLGCFVNNVPLRINLKENVSFQETIKRVISQIKTSSRHQRCSLTDVIKTLRKIENIQNQELLNVSIMQTYVKEHPLALNGIEVNHHDERNHAVYDLNLQYYEQDGKIKFKLNYRDSLFESWFIKQFVEHFKCVAGQCAEDMHKNIYGFSLLTDVEEEKILVNWNDTAANFSSNKTVHQLFEEQVKKTPNRTAIIFEGTVLTYRELNERANQLAHTLRERYLKFEGEALPRDTLIGLGVPRGIEMIVGILGIWKAGGAYVPLDPEYPEKYLHHILEDSDLKMFVTQEGIQIKYPFAEKGVEIICFSRDAAGLAQAPRENTALEQQASDLAYIIYTSGSTGVPKGVEIEHISVVNTVEAVKDIIQVSENDRFLAVTSVCFDVSVFDYCLPLLSGASMNVASHLVQKDGQQLIKLMEDADINVMQATPTTWDVLIEDKWQGAPGFKILNVGEALPKTLAKKLFDKGTIFNLYGPTEATIQSTLAKIEHPNAITIGKPLANVQAYIVDEYLNPVPVGVCGELILGGVGLARGYLNRKELTAEKFIPSPFEENARLYKAGDFARWRTDGQIDWLERIDNQVKIRGFRIELGEIEAALLEHQAIKQVVALPMTDNVYSKYSVSSKYIVAYFVLKNQQDKVTHEELYNFLKDKLPSYMMPRFFFRREEIPLLPNGKINKAQLAEMLMADYVVSHSKNEGPHNKTEEIVLDTFKKLLKVDSIGADYNFFDLGVYSLTLVKALHLLNEHFDNKLKVIDLFTHPTVRSLATFISALLKPQAASDTEKLDDTTIQRLQARKKRLKQKRDTELEPALQS